VNGDNENIDDVAEGGDTPAADAGEEAATEPAEEPAAPRRGQRRRLEKAKKEELGNWAFFETHDPSQTSEVILRGEGIGANGGDAEKIGNTIARVAHLFKTLVDGEAYMHALAFQSSVHIWFRPSTEEIARAERELQRAKETRDERVAKHALEEAVTDIQVATALAADLLEASPVEAPVRAVTLGTNVAQAYKSLAATVVRGRLSVTLEAPERDEPVQLTARKAERVAEALKEVTQPEKFKEVVFGTLSLADAMQKTFGLIFDPGSLRSETFKGKRVIRGSFTPKVEDVIRDKGLWGKRVRATIEVERDALVSTSRIRPPEYRLLDVEEALT
jgi:hypothetical protein